VFLDGFLSSAQDLKRVIVGSHAGRPIYLGSSQKTENKAR